MFTKLLRALFLILAFWPSLAMADTCVFGEVTDEAFSSAKFIFVFRVLGTEIHEGKSAPIGAESGFGRLRVVENLRGSAPYQSFTFSAHRGCGSKLVPGHYYVGVASSPKGKFFAGPATVLDLGSEYREGVDNAHAFRTFSKLASAVTGPTSTDFGAPLQAAMAELAKAQLVGTRETAALAAEMAAVYGEALFNLMAAAKPLHELKIDIKISGDMYDQEFAEGKRVLSEITALNESGSPNPAKMAILQRSFEHYQNRYSKYSDERNASWESYNAQSKIFVQSVFAELSKISSAQTKLLHAIRTEIGLDTDASELNLRMEANKARMEKATADLLAHLDGANT